MFDARWHSHDARLAALRALSGFARLAIMAALIAIGLLRNAAPLPPLSAERISDVGLYQRIVADLRAGQPYYAVVVREHRQHGYPLRPFVTVRLPTLAWILAWLPNPTAQRLILGLIALAAIMAWAARLAAARTPPLQYVTALIALIVGASLMLAPDALFMHEIWAGLLIALSMALRRPNAWLAAVVIGTAAALLRELAAPYLLVMALMAIRERNFREAGAWCAGLAVFAGALAVHAAEVHALAVPGDTVSPGWLALGGWRFVLETTRWVPDVFHLGWCAAILLPLALLGLTARPIDWRLSLTVGGYVAGFIFVGRHNTTYWGFIIAPLWPMGLARAWSAVAECLGDIRDGLSRRDYPNSVFDSGAA